MTDNELTSEDGKQYSLTNQPSSVKGENHVRDSSTIAEAFKHASLSNRSEDDDLVDFDDAQDELTSAGFETIDNSTKSYTGDRFENI